MFGMHRRDFTLIAFLLATVIAVLAVMGYGAREFGDRLIRVQAEEQALRWGEFVRQNLDDIDSTVAYGRIVEEDQEVIAVASEAGNIFRYKIFNQDGTIVLASRLDDLGLVNTKPYFAAVVMKGKNYVKIEKEDKFPELGPVESVDTTVAEAYIPIMEGGQFMGAIEIYSDATALANNINEQIILAQWGILALLAIFALMASIIISLNIKDRNRQLSTILRAHESMGKAEDEVLRLNEELEQRVAERTAELEKANQVTVESAEGMKQLNEELERRVDERTAELNKANERTMKLNQDLEQRVEERTAQVSNIIDQLYKANESITKLNESLEQRVNERTVELNKANERITNMNQELEERVNERTAELNAANANVTELNQELEQRVNDRTAELNAANANVTELNQELEQRVNDRTTELQETQKELVQKERLAALGQLTATVSHELRNPLGAIRTAIYLIRGRTQEKGLEVESALERADRSILRCDNIINELLDFTRSTPLAMEKTSFDTWLEDVLDEQSLPVGVTLRKDIAAEDARLAFDQERFRRVVINLFNNACEAMLESPESGKSEQEHILDVTTAALDDRLEVVFHDNGPGIPAEVLTKIFEPLYSTKSFGVGLGLPTVRQIMQQHGGGIDITSEPDQGTSVTLWLPLNRADERAA